MGREGVESEKMQDASPRQHATSEKSRMPDQDKMHDASPRQDATSEKQHRRPFRNLLEDSEEARRQYLHVAVPLYRAALRNDWVAAEIIIRKDREILCTAITSAEETVLHIAVGAKHLQFVKNLLNLMDEDEVALQDCNGNTAFSLAVASGSLEVAMILMQKNAQLPLFRGGQGQTPLYIAALFGYAEIAWFLYPLTKATLDQKEWIWIFFTCIHSDLYGLGLKMFEDDSALAMARDINDDTALHILARKPLAFLQQSSGLWTRYTGTSLITSCETNFVESVALKLTRGLWKEILMQLPDFNVKQLIDNPTRVLFEAAEVGNFPFLVELIHSYPDLVWKVDDKNRTIFHVAVLKRHADIFNLIHEIGYAKHVIVTFKDNEDNNMLHLAATLPPQHRQNAELGGTLNLHHELVWFEAVKKIMHPSYAELKNSNGFTPQDVFTITHASLFKDGERWMKDTAKFGMLVSVLMTIGVFLASFHAVNGEEIILVSSHVLNVSVLVALASSSISTLMFLSILTSNYEKMNFLYVLPFELITGLVTLFIAMSTMMAAFNRRLFISLPHGLKWAATLTFTGTFIPVALFVLVQHYQLLSNMWDSIFVSKLLSGKGKYHAFHRKTNASL